MNELLAHLIGDYILQSHDMALNKTKNSYWAFYHAFMYTLPFLLLTLNPLPLSIILLTHLLIDRFRLAIYVVKTKNYLFGTFDKKVFELESGFPLETPNWLYVWLIIIIDNTMHLTINHLVINYF